MKLIFVTSKHVKEWQLGPREVFWRSSRHVLLVQMRKFRFGNSQRSRPQGEETPTEPLRLVKFTHQPQSCSAARKMKKMGRELKLAKNERLEHGERLRIKILHMFTGWINVFEQQIALVQHKRKGERSPILRAMDTTRTKAHTKRRLKKAVTVSPPTSCTALFGFSVYKKYSRHEHVVTRDMCFTERHESFFMFPMLGKFLDSLRCLLATKKNTNDPSLRLGKGFVHFGHSNTSKEHMNCIADMNSIQHAREFWVRTRFSTKRPKTQLTRMPVILAT